MNRKKITLCETKNIILLNCHWLALILLSYYLFFTDYLFIGCQIICLFVFIYSKEILSKVTNNGHCTLNWIGTVLRSRQFNTSPLRVPFPQYFPLSYRLSASLRYIYRNRTTFWDALWLQMIILKYYTNSFFHVI